jgi:hypothetical protein
VFLVLSSQKARYRISCIPVVNGRYCTSSTFLENGEISYFLYPFRKRQEIHFLQSSRKRRDIAFILFLSFSILTSSLVS